MRRSSTAPHPAFGHPLPAVRGEGSPRRDPSLCLRGEGARSADEGRVRDHDEKKSFTVSNTPRSLTSCGDHQQPLTRPSATLSPPCRARVLRVETLLPACGEKVREARMRGACAITTRRSLSPSRTRRARSRPAAIIISPSPSLRPPSPRRAEVDGPSRRDPSPRLRGEGARSADEGRVRDHDEKKSLTFSKTPRSLTSSPLISASCS
jgi:predicted transcriptional regulator